MGRSITISMTEDDADDREMAKENSSPRPGLLLLDLNRARALGSYWLESSELPPGELPDVG